MKHRLGMGVRAIAGACWQASQWTSGAGSVKGALTTDVPPHSRSLCNAMLDAVLLSISFLAFAGNWLYEFRMELQLWASCRGQLLGRTVTGMLRNEKASRANHMTYRNGIQDEACIHVQCSIVCLLPPA
jgi:hypothetical protein